MPHKILILDDDSDFNSLLTDIFEQADYAVSSMTDPKKAIEAFRENDFDLVVTDHKMPEMTGAEFMVAIKEIKPEVPVIMVSGFLENDTIRELISQGVGGVFLKPLNIFSLLERSNEVISDAKKIAASAKREAVEASGGEEESGLGFPFLSFPGKSPVTKAFAERLHSQQNFKSTLSLIGEPGTHYRMICEDMRSFASAEKEPFLYFDVSSFNADSVITACHSEVEKGAERVTCVLLDIDKMSDAQKSLAASLPGKKGPFESLDLSLRAIFCLNGDLDYLFDEGLIDENLYILMGTMEIKVPALRECGSEVGLIAQQLVDRIAAEKGVSPVPRVEKSARDLIGSHKWEKNFAELEATMRRVIDSGPQEKITYASVKEALSRGTTISARSTMLEDLSGIQNEFIQAAALLLDDDETKVAGFFACDEIEKIASQLK